METSAVFHHQGSRMYKDSACFKMKGKITTVVIDGLKNPSSRPVDRLLVRLQPLGVLSPKKSFEEEVGNDKKMFCRLICIPEDGFQYSSSLGGWSKLQLLGYVVSCFLKS